MRLRLIALIAAAAVSVVAVAGCSTQARAERRGKEAGDEICKAKNANTANEAQRHLRRANDDLNDLARFTGRDVHEDIHDLDRNLNQLARGNASDQDLNAIVRSIEDARRSAVGNAAAAYDGLLESLASCN